MSICKFTTECSCNFCSNEICGASLLINSLGGVERLDPSLTLEVSSNTCLSSPSSCGTYGVCAMHFALNSSCFSLLLCGVDKFMVFPSVVSSSVSSSSISLTTKGCALMKSADPPKSLLVCDKCDELDVMDPLRLECSLIENEIEVFLGLEYSLAFSAAVADDVP